MSAVRLRKLLERRCGNAKNALLHWIRAREANSCFYVLIGSSRDEKVQETKQYFTICLNEGNFELLGGYSSFLLINQLLSL